MNYRNLKELFLSGIEVCREKLDSMLVDKEEPSTTKGIASL